jgi:hypothetical protein
MGWTVGILYELDLGERNAAVTTGQRITILWFAMATATPNATSSPTWNTAE